MNIFTSKRLITTAFVLLVTLNLILLGVLWQQNANRRFTCQPQSPRGSRAALLAPLALSDSQNCAFKQLREEHVLTIQPELAQLYILKKELVSEALKEQPNTQEINRLTTAIGSLQATVERRRAEHFHELAKLCSPAQRDSLKSVLERMVTNDHGMRMGRMNRHRP